VIFQNPILFLLLAILPILGKILAHARRKRNEAAAKLRGQKKVSTGWKKGVALQLGAFTALILALAQPAWNPHPGPLQVQGRDLVIALDISRSMLADDVFPTRLDAAKISLYESLDLLRGQKIGLITFAGAASVRVPLTLDHNFVRYMLERAQPADADVGSTSLQAAIEKAIDIALSESKKGKQDILIFTDGEDHISDIETTTEELRECGARVLIVGIGDSVAGAKVPDIVKTNAWMQYKGEDVVTRLDEEKLFQLSSGSPNVSYHAAQTRPFDLIALYHQLITDTADLPVGDDTLLVYTEGYPFFIALALLLWLVPLNKRLFPALALLIMVSGCGKEVPQENKHLQTGKMLWEEAQEAAETDPNVALFTLAEAREQFLQAAMQQPGDPAIAQQIAGLSAQIRVIKQTMQEQEEAEQDLQQKLQEAIELLQLLVQRENVLAQTSQQLLRKRPPTPHEEKAAAVEPARIEQSSVEEGTGTVLETVTEVRSFIQKMLSARFSDGEEAPPTEFDEVVNKLTQAQTSQTDAVKNLAPAAVSWPQANSAFQSATRQMQDALRLLSDQNQSQDADDNSEMDEDYEMDEDMEWSESDMPSDMTTPMDSSNFKTSLENRSLPTPNYTAEEILMEEAANMEQRAEQKAKQTDSKVERNW